MAAQAAYAFVRNTRAGAIAAAWLVVLALVSTASAQVAQNSATVTAPSGINDLNAANNAATDSDPITIPLTLRKQWSSAFPGDDSVINVSRGATVIDTLNSDAGTANELDTDPTPVQVVRGETLTLNESVTGSGAYNQVLTCTGAADANPADGLTVGNADTAIVCTYTNTRRSATVTLTKAWTNAISGNAVSLTIGGGSAAVAGASTAPSTTTNATATALTGDTVTLTESFNAGNSANYNTALACRRTSDSSPVAVTGTGASGTIVMPDFNVTCAFTNTRKSTTLVLNKTWDGNSNDGAVITIPAATVGGTAITASFNATAGTPANSATVTVYAGDTVRLPAETGSIANYNAALTCNGGAIANTNGQTASDLAIRSTDTAPIACTYANTRKTAQLSLSKTWQNAAVGNAAQITVARGATTIRTFNAAATTANQTINDPAGAITVMAGETLALNETITNGSGNYAASLACSGTTGLSGSNLTVGSTDATIGCVYTNARRTSTVTLRKDWVNGRLNDTATVTAVDGAATIATLNAVSSGAASELDAGSPVTVFAGQTLSLSETVAPSGLYLEQLAGCTGAADTNAADGLLVGAGETIVCTYRNSRESSDIVTTKTRLSASPVANGGQVQFQITVENKGPVASTGVSLTDNLPSGLAYLSHTETAGTTYVPGTGVWTIGNLANAATATLTITATASGAAGATIVNTTTRAVNDQFDPVTNTDSLSASVTIATPGVELTKTAGPITDTDSPANGVADVGDTIAYSFSVRNTGNIALGGIVISDPKLPSLSCSPSGPLAPGAIQAMTCTDNVYTLASGDLGTSAGPGSVSNTASVSATPTGGAAGSVTDTDSRTVSVPRKQTTLQLLKSWVNASNGAQITATASVAGSTRATINSTVNGATPATETGSGSVVTVSVGEEITFNAETFNAGVAANYEPATISCNSVAVPVGGTLTVPSESGPIVCTYTNTRKSTTLQLAKTWFDPIAGDTAQIGATSGHANPTTPMSSVVAPADGTSNAVTIFAGEQVTLPAETMSPGSLTNYTVTLACPGGVLSGTNGKVSNTLTAPTTVSAGSPIICTYTNTFASQPDISLFKSGTLDLGSDGVATVGDVITYQFLVTNAGNATLDDIELVDLVPSVTITSVVPASLASGASATITGTYSITQADIDAGQAVNTAKVSATDPYDTAVEATSGATVPINGEPRITIVKTQMSGKSPVDAVGDVIGYRIVVTNTGNVTLNTVDNPVSVTDTYPGALSATTLTNPAESGAADGLLQVGETWTYLTNYTVTQADIDANAGGANQTSEPLVNLADVAVDLPAPDTDLAASSSVSTPVRHDPSISVEKAAGTPTATSGPGGNETGAGDTVQFTITVRNTGNVTLQNVIVSDTLPNGTVIDNDPDTPGGLTLPTPTQSIATNAVLEVGESWTYSVTYSLVQDDIDAGRAYNVVTANGSSLDDVAAPQGSGDATAAIPQEPALLVEKEADRDSIAVPGLINYTIKVTNIGTTRQEDILVVDQMPYGRGEARNDPATAVGESTENVLIGVNQTSLDLDPGESFTYTMAFRVNQDDLDSGNDAENEVTATSDTANTDTTVTINNAQPGLSVDKTQIGGPSPVTAAGQVIQYRIVVTNTGQVTETNVVASDVLPDATTIDNDPGTTGGDLPVPVQSIATNAVLEVGETWTYTVDYTVRQEDIDAGAALVNSVTVSTDNFPAGVTDSVSTPVDLRPAISIDKRAALPLTDTNGDGVIGADDTINYTFEVTNTGLATLNGVVVSDPKFPANSINCTATTLAPGASTDCTAPTYSIQQSEATAGSVANTATATGTAGPVGNTTAVSASDTVTIPIAPDPRLTIDKTVSGIDDANSSGINDADDFITYNFTVKNTGNVPLTAVNIDDSRIGVGDLAVSPADLAPGQTGVATATYLITTADEDSGAVVNSATASGTPPSGPAIDSAPDATTTRIVKPAPGLTIEKTAMAPADVNASGLTDAGDTIGYYFEVTNTGNVPLTSISISDDKITTASCPAVSVAPGATLRCPAGASVFTYTIKSTDTPGQPIINTATASGVPPAGPAITSLPDSTSTSTDLPDPSIELTKVAGAYVDVNNSGIVDAGDTIPYTLTVRNNGNVPLTDVSVSDPKAGAVSCPAGALDVLDVDESVVCSASYTIDANTINNAGGQSDSQLGQVENIATASGTPPDTDTGDADAIDSNVATTTTPVATPDPAVIFEKRIVAINDRSGSGINDAGDTIQYEFAVTNSGNVPLVDVDIVDDKVDNESCPAGELPVAPGDTIVCSASVYTITSADYPAPGTVVNTAHAVVRRQNIWH